MGAIGKNIFILQDQHSVSSGEKLVTYVAGLVGQVSDGLMMFVTAKHVVLMKGSSERLVCSMTIVACHYILTPPVPLSAMLLPFSL